MSSPDLWTIAFHTMQYYALLSFGCIKIIHFIQGLLQSFIHGEDDEKIEMLLKFLQMFYDSNTHHLEFYTNSSTELFFPSYKCNFF